MSNESLSLRQIISIFVLISRHFRVYRRVTKLQVSLSGLGIETLKGLLLPGGKISFLFPFSNVWRLTDWPGAGLVSAYVP